MKKSVKVPYLPPKLEGSAAWAIDQLSKMSRTIRIKDDVPVVLVNESQELAWVDHAEDLEDDYRYQRKEVVRFLAPNSGPETHREREGLFRCPLTPAAEELVQDFLEEVAEQLLERWNQDWVD